MNRPWLSALVAFGLLGGASIGLADEVRPDNSVANARDKSGETTTPIDQGTSAQDVRITQSIRKAITDDEKLSVNAQNVKVVTRDGAVTLRGPVGSAAERASIEAKAKAVTGVTRVDNQIEIASQ